MLHSVVIA